MNRGNIYKIKWLCQKLKIRDLTLRDGNSLCLRLVLPRTDKPRFTWSRDGFLCDGSLGCAVPDSVMRYFERGRGLVLKQSMKAGGDLI